MTEYTAECEIDFPAGLLDYGHYVTALIHYDDNTNVKVTYEPSFPEGLVTIEAVSTTDYDTAAASVARNKEVVLNFIEKLYANGKESKMILDV